MCLFARLMKIICQKNVKFTPQKLTGYTDKFGQMQLYVEVHTSERTRLTESDVFPKIPEIIVYVFTR